MSDLGAYLKGLEDDPKTRKRFRRRPLCETLAGNTVELLTITSFTAEPDALASRKGVVVSARVHPGETNASYMMKGIIDYLTGPSLDAKILRDNFVFKIIPVLNPDGVVVGNYRCSLAGLDLNRMWKDPSKRLTPTVWHAKQMMKRLSEDRELVLFCGTMGRVSDVAPHTAPKLTSRSSLYRPPRPLAQAQHLLLRLRAEGSPRPPPLRDDLLEAALAQLGVVLLLRLQLQGATLEGEHGVT